MRRFTPHLWAVVKNEHHRFVAEEQLPERLAAVALQTRSAGDHVLVQHARRLVLVPPRMRGFVLAEGDHAVEGVSAGGSNSPLVNDA
jgi:hypothetical protein